MPDVPENRIMIGWGRRDVTPARPVVLGAQFRQRISDGVDGPVTVTAMALSTVEPSPDSVVFVSGDDGGFRHRWYDDNDFLVLCRQAIHARLPEIDVDKVIFNATHTHTAPNMLVGRYGSEEALPPGVMLADDYFRYFLGQMVEAVGEAWESRQEAGVSWGLGTAVVGHNRRATYSAESGSHAAGAVTNGLTQLSHRKKFEKSFLRLNVFGLFL